MNERKKAWLVRILIGGVLGTGAGVLFSLGDGIWTVYHWYGIFLAAAFGASVGVSTLPFADDGRSVARRSMLHYLISMVLFVGAVVFLSHLYRWDGALLWAGLYTAGYLTIWLSRYAGWWMELEAIRAKLGLAQSAPTPLRWKETLPFAPVGILVYLLLPATLRGVEHLSGEAVPALTALIYPCILLPLGSMASGVALGKRQGFCPLYLLLCAVCLTVFALGFLNETALYMAVIGVLFTAVGEGIGVFLRRERDTDKQAGVRNRAFWVFLILFFVGAYNLVSAMWAGVPTLDNGGGFISLSPWIDCVVWGGWMAGFLVPTILYARKSRPHWPELSPVWQPVCGFFAVQSVLVLGVILLGVLGVLYPYGGRFLPLPVYAVLLAAAYLALGFLWGGKRRPSVGWLLGWCLILAGVFLALGLGRCLALDAQDARWAAEYGGSYMAGYTERVMDSAAGAVLGRLNLPACVVLGNYDVAYYDGVHTLSRTAITALCCLCPPVLFTLGALAGRLRNGKKPDEA
ncbi:hypothetical protein H7U37_10360 [Pseudoflavonifractor phocaeensis]|uniref:hypothetical protein n=1 Tax=Pseudoflavonifractor phocaeensis TaxID=1870988 RepID=UPI00195F1943|nr:hypothetical protein [Pseudoflavonifractor phocaeensis]MBM6938922.1 hypothetical protein [Pseudoflavonifractor phocaeensis]